MAWKAIRYPRNTLGRLKLLTPYNLKLLIHLLANNDTRILKARINHYLTPHTDSAPPRHIDLYEGTDESPLRFPLADAPLVSIIIPAFNQWDYTFRCLRSILGARSKVSYEIIVADDNSSDRTREIGAYVENVTVVRSETNMGFLRNCNHAATRAKGRYLVFLNNDTAVQPEWLDTLVAVMARDPDVGLVGSKLLFQDGLLQEAGGIIWSDGSGWNYGRFDDPEKPQYNYVKEVDYVSGASLMIRKDLWDMLGGFDERFAPAYYEDTDLAFRVRASGRKVVYQPRSVVVHFEGVSNGTDLTAGIKRYQQVNHEKFVSKWADTLERDHFSPGANTFKARDRSAARPTILVVDHYVPQFDKDAGSRMTYMFLKLFVEMGFNVKFLGDNYVKHQPYTAALEDLGIEVLYGPWHQHDIRSWFQEHGPQIDVAMLTRPHVASKHLKNVQKFTRAKILYFGHDLHHLREQRRYEITGDRAALRSARHWLTVEGRLFRASDLTLTVSDHETRMIQRDFPQTEVVTIPLFFFDQPAAPRRDFATRHDMLFVGGFSHPPNLDGITWFIREVLPLIRTRIPEATLTVVGSNPPAELCQFQAEHITITGFVSDEELTRLYDAARLVVVPLRYGAGMKGKTVEALHRGVPIVSTTNGVEGLPGIDALCRPQDDAAGFADEVVRLYGDPEALAGLSEAASRYIQVHYSKAAARALWARILSR